MQTEKIITREDLRHKKVLVRTDFNVPTENGTVSDNSRIKNALPLIKFLKEADAKIILISHMGKTTCPNLSQSLKIVAEEVSRIYDSEVIFINNCLDENAKNIIGQSPNDAVILMENLRFHPGEEKCDPEFARRLASSADFYINEAFSVSHRKHASIFEIPRFLPHAVGFSFQNEIDIIDRVLGKTESPKMCIIGGAKLSTKINLLKNLSAKIDKLALGGEIAGAFLSFFGNSSMKIFDSETYREDVAAVVENARNCNCQLILPTDFSALVNEGGVFHYTVISSGNESSAVFDIGPGSIELFKKHIRESKIVLWNGPLGLFEKAPFDFGTKSIAKEIAQLTRDGKLISVIGGGDTGFAMRQSGVADDLSHISSAGGAFLAYLEGGELPGIAAMKDACILKK
ncbi:MAG: phosphoglycerate kinase [Holosporaceae bacterium]|nr:phosphoglycerate kinase [Holosporaceae bacterium]